MLKTCSKCSENKSFPEKFHRGGKKKDGSYYYYSYCMSCYNQQRKEYSLKTGRIKTKPFNVPSEDLIDKEFGNLVVKKYAGKIAYSTKSSHTRHAWLCQCVCGNETIVNENNLKSNTTKSCGCSKKQKGIRHRSYKGCGDLSKSMWTSIKWNANKKELEFDITIEYAWDLFVKQNGLCKLSNLPISFASTVKEYHNGVTTASLDRIDSSKGYIKDNVQWVHKHINLMKLNHNEKYFIILCSAVVSHATSINKESGPQLL